MREVKVTKQHTTFNDLQTPEWLPEAHASADLGVGDYNVLDYY